MRAGVLLELARCYQHLDRFDDMLTYANKANAIAVHDLKAEINKTRGIAMVEVGKREYPGSQCIINGIAELKNAQQILSESQQQDS